MDGEKPPEALALPRLPLRASIYIDPDGTVQFGALFEELLPVARALGARDGEASAPPAAAGDDTPG